VIAANVCHDRLKARLLRVKENPDGHRHQTEKQFFSFAHERQQQQRHAQQTEIDRRQA
jgi:hypothetical protein